MSQVDLCTVLGMDRAVVNKWSKLGMPVIERKGKKLYSPKAIFDWKIKYEKDRAKQSVSLDGDLGGETSDALERYRTIKAKQAEFDLDIKMGLFVPREKYEETLKRAATYMRKYLQNLGKLLGIKLAKERKAASIIKAIEAEVEGILRRSVEEFVPDE